MKSRRRHQTTNTTIEHLKVMCTTRLEDVASYSNSASLKELAAFIVLRAM